MVLSLLKQNLPEGDPFPVAAGSCLYKMDQNESPLDLPALLKHDLLSRLEAMPWSRYPQPGYYHEVKEKIAPVLGIAAENFALTNGCDGAIQGVHFLSGGCGRKALVIQPTYPMLRHAAWLAGTEIVTVDAGPDYHFDSSVFAGHHLILIANPNNPTGTVTPISLILNALSLQTILFLDEAYFDFSGMTMINALDDHPNLVIGRSFSKSMLAGIRLGALLGHRDIIRRYESLVTAPYHLSNLQLVVAENYHRILPHVQQMAETVIRERERLAGSLKILGVKTYPSHANFILMQLEKPQQVFNGLLTSGIRIRNMCRIPGLESHLRVTVGNQMENDAFLDAMRLEIDGLNF